MEQVYQMLQSLSWPLVVVSLLLVVSEALPYFPNIEANSTVQLIKNILIELKAKLSLKPAKTEETKSE